MRILLTRAYMAPVLIMLAGHLRAETNDRPIANLTGAVRFVAMPTSAGDWGIAVRNAGISSAGSLAPISVMLSTDPTGKPLTASYRTMEIRAGGLSARGELRITNGVTISVEDSWTAAKDTLRLERNVAVRGTAPESTGYASGIVLEHPSTLDRSAFEVFAPGLIYGSTAHLTPSAISGLTAYRSGAGTVYIREDRMPAPVYGVRFADGTSLTVLDPSPNGASTAEDSNDTAVNALTNEHFAFGAIGSEQKEGHPAEGFWFPGSEGEITYRGKTYPGGQEHRWRYRYHPLQDGARQHYSVQFRFSNTASFPAFQRECWRWAFTTLAPSAVSQNIAVIESSITDVLAANAVAVDGRMGIPNAMDAVDPARHSDNKAILGFTGKNIEAAEFLLAEADRESDVSRARRERELGLAIFQSFMRLKVAPPAGEGFYLQTGLPALAIPREHCVFLRSFGDDMKSTMRAYLREKRAGRVHPEWLAWAQSFADWLLTQQAKDGSFPRSWKPGTGEVLDRSPQSSYNAISFLLLLAEATGDARYRSSAVRSGEFVWSSGQAQGQFVGGTIDNPDILDKEAGALSLEAYLALYQSTMDRRWITRAEVAADYAESYIYLWNVPMPLDSAALQWNRQASTVGTQLIATGHSLVDEYMSFDVDSYARLWKLTGDVHYKQIARLLLHGTKVMVATPERRYDLRGPGWQQEHWSFAPVRGTGLHRSWLPWVATSQLKGIIALREYDPALFAEMAK